MQRIVIATVLLALCIAHVQASMTEDAARFVRESNCLEKENLTMSDVETFELNEKLAEAETSRELKCFGACLLEYTGVMDNCNINEKTVAGIEMLKDGHQFIVSCKGAVDASERCECAYQFVKCMVEMYS